MFPGIPKHMTLKWYVAELVSRPPSPRTWGMKEIVGNLSCFRTGPIMHGGEVVVSKLLWHNAKPLLIARDEASSLGTREASSGKGIYLWHKKAHLLLAQGEASSYGIDRSLFL